MLIASGLCAAGDRGGGDALDVGRLCGGVYDRYPNDRFGHSSDWAKWAKASEFVESGLKHQEASRGVTQDVFRQAGIGNPRSSRMTSDIYC